MARPLPNDTLARYQEAQSIRSRYDNDFRLAAAYCMPSHYNGWGNNGPGLWTQGSTQAARRVAYDTTGMRALPKYMAILERMCTPHNMIWQSLTVSDRSLSRNRFVREYFDELNKTLFKFRYEAKANFKQAISETYGSLGTYGTAPIFYGQRRLIGNANKRGFLYRALSLRDHYVLVNDEGEIDTHFRRIWLNARQFRQKFPKIETMPKCFTKAAPGMTEKETDYCEFVHVVQPRTDWDRDAIDARRHPFVGSYLNVKDVEYVGDEEGYASMPYLAPRTYTEAGNPYGFSPAAQALPAMGTASAIKKTSLKQGQKAADPTLLAHDDGVVNGQVDQRPGAVNYGGLDKQGRELIKVLPTGNFNVGEKMLQDERSDINDSFFVTLFQILMETPEMTATEVMERVAEKSALLSPTMGRIQSELLGPGTMREIDMLVEMGVMPEMPPELIEAKGEYDIVYTSPMAKGMYAEEVSGFMRAVDMARAIVADTQDPSHLDHFNFGVAIPEMSEYMAVPARWMNDDKAKAAIQSSRAEAQQQQQLMKNAAPIAGALKTVSQMQEPEVANG